VFAERERLSCSGASGILPFSFCRKAIAIAIQSLEYYVSALQILSDRTIAILQDIAFVQIFGS